MFLLILLKEETLCPRQENQNTKDKGDALLSVGFYLKTDDLLLGIQNTMEDMRKQMHTHTSQTKENRSITVPLFKQKHEVLEHTPNVRDQ